MDFFTHQEHARKQTWKLVTLFGLAVVGIIAALYFVSVFAFQFADQRAAPSLWRPEVLAVVAGGVLTVVVVGSSYKLMQLRGGGSVVAQALGGRRVLPASTDPIDRKLYNVVEEMSVASGTPMPDVYIMDHEPAINAFAAGQKPSDAAIGVTRGCIEQLSRDELQGVIAHEFSHIFNGDMRLNIRLMGVLHGILCIALAGYLILRSGAGFRSRNSKNNGGGILALAVAMIAVGYIGMFFARLIQAAVSRQREFLADASAVQYTRSPLGIAGALRKIGGIPEGSLVQSGQAQAASHMFFGEAVKGAFLNAMATHPPLAERIARIEGTPVGKVESPRRRRASAPAAAGAAAGVMGFDAGTATTPDELLGQTGQPSEEHIQHGRTLLESLPLAVTVAMHEPYSARSVIFAMLLDRQPEPRRTQLRELTNLLGGAVAHETAELAHAIHDLDRSALLPIVDLTIPALRELSSQQYAEFARAVQVLITSDERIDLFEFVLQKITLRHLRATYSTPDRVQPEFKRLAPVAQECRLLLSMLAGIGHDSDEERSAAYRAGAAGISPIASSSILPPSETGFIALDGALDRLARTTPPCKRTILRACLDTIAHDGRIALSEAELVRAVADTLDCPMPPVLGATPD